jgi:hypothetical protein
MSCLEKKEEKSLYVFMFWIHHPSYLPNDDAAPKTDFKCQKLETHNILPLSTNEMMIDF